MADLAAEAVAVVTAQICPKSDAGHYYIKRRWRLGQPSSFAFWTCANCGHEDRNPLCPCEACQAADLAQLRTTGRGQR